MFRGEDAADKSEDHEGARMQPNVATQQGEPVDMPKVDLSALSSADLTLPDALSRSLLEALGPRRGDEDVYACFDNSIMPLPETPER